MIQTSNTNNNHRIRDQTTKKAGFTESIYNQYIHNTNCLSLNKHLCIINMYFFNKIVLVWLLPLSTVLSCSALVFSLFLFSKHPFPVTALFLMQAQPQSHLVQCSAMRRLWAWPTISRHTAYMCVASTLGSNSVSLGPERVQDKLPRSWGQIHHWFNICFGVF